VRADDDADEFFQFEGAASAQPAAGDAPEPPRVPPRLGLLAELTIPEFDEVARAAKLSHVLADTVVFTQGNHADRFFILVDGSVEVIRDSESLATLGPGAFFGESALLVGGRRSATIQTLTECTLWSISYVAFDGAVSHHLMADPAAGAEATRRIDGAPPGAFDHPSEG